MLKQRLLVVYADDTKMKNLRTLNNSIHCMIPVSIINSSCAPQY